MLEEIANLRDQLLEVLEGKIAADEGLVPLTSPQVEYCPRTLVATLQLLTNIGLSGKCQCMVLTQVFAGAQKKSLASELAAAGQENELLRIEVLSNSPHST